MVRGWLKNQVSSPDFDISQLPIGQTDLTRLTRGQRGRQFWSAFVPWCVIPPAWPPDCFPTETNGADRDPLVQLDPTTSIERCF